MQVTAQLEPTSNGAVAGRLDIEQQETQERIVKLLSRLPENQQEVVRLKFQAGLSYREISGVTQLSVSNVGYLLHTALATLRRQLTTEGAGP